MASLARALSQARARRPRQVPLEMPTQSNPGRYTADGETRLINCYAESAGKEGKTPFPIYACDGFSDFATLTGGGVGRGLFPTETRLIALSGRLLFWTDTGGGVTTIGGVPDDGPVYFSRNRASTQQIVLTTTGGLKYVLTFDGASVATLTEITDTDLPTPNSNGFLDGYTLYFIQDGRVFYSAIDQADSIGANDFFEAEGDPDKLARGFVHKRTIFLLGKETTELWDSVGDANNPFQRSPGGFLPYGCGAPASVVKFGDNIAFVDNNFRVVLGNTAGATRRISTHAVERSIDALSDGDKALIEGSVYDRRGHKQYILSGSSFTWVYDELTGWHERLSDGETRWRATYCVPFAGKHIVQDFEQGKLYQMDPDTYSEAGTNMTAIIRVPIHAWPNPITLNRLKVDMIPGVGLNSADLHTSDPQLMLKLSKDGGKNYGNSYSRSIGKIGQYTAQTEFSKGGGDGALGTSGEDGFIAELSCSAAVIRGFTGLSSDIKVLRR
jgi:hypothetical protein